MALSTRLGVVSALAASLGVAFLFSAPVQAQNVNELRRSVQQTDACLMRTTPEVYLWEHLSAAQMLERLERNPDIRQDDFRCARNVTLSGVLKLDRRVDGGAVHTLTDGRVVYPGLFLADTLSFSLPKEGAQCTVTVEPWPTQMGIYTFTKIVKARICN
jgi:hypothetical protein